MNYEEIVKYFLNCQYDVEPSKYLGSDSLSVSFEVGNEILKFIHLCVPELTQLPHFFLADHKKYGSLAHVDPSLGSICVNHLDSVSVNFERPELAFEESIKRHIVLVAKLIEDPKFNQQELLREFNVNWNFNIGKLRKEPKKLYCSSINGGFESVDIYKPEFKDSISSLPASYVAISKEGFDLVEAKFLNKKNRVLQKYSAGFVIPLTSVNMNLPSTHDELKMWLLDALTRVDDSVKKLIANNLFTQKSKEFWLVFNVQTPSGRAWFSLKLSQNKRKSFPNNKNKLNCWTIAPIFVEVFNKNLMMPRSGALSSLSDKKVLIVGCGSVGSEIADKIGSLGVGSVRIVDPDIYTLSNLYRHTLNLNNTDWPKSCAVSLQLSRKYPWIEATHDNRRLLDLRDIAFLSKYDLVIVATGAPTHERLFHDYVAKNKIKVAVLYTWLEGYGVGGHAVLDIAERCGCLRCAYVEADTGIRGLFSNLNFIEPNQNVVKNYAGCGEMYIPYGAISSAQTALIATDLASKYLEKKVIKSTKVSWKGDDSEAKKEGLTLSKRYNLFQSSLKLTELYNPLCDVCNNEEYEIYELNAYKLIIPSNIHQQLIEYRQTEKSMSESAGLLIGYYKKNGEVWVEQITKPKESDMRARGSFKLNAKAHQKEINDAYHNSDGLLGYIGTWHTHPQDIPIPSNVDLVDWQEHDVENIDRQLFFIVVGLKETSIYTIANGETVKLHDKLERKN